MRFNAVGYTLIEGCVDTSSLLVHPSIV